MSSFEKVQFIVSLSCYCKPGFYTLKTFCTALHWGSASALVVVRINYENAAAPAAGAAGSSDPCGMHGGSQRI